MVRVPCRSLCRKLYIRSERRSGVYLKERLGRLRARFGPDLVPRTPARAGYDRPPAPSTPWPGIKGEARRAAPDRPLGRALLRRHQQNFCGKTLRHKVPRTSVSAPTRRSDAALSGCVLNDGPAPLRPFAPGQGAFEALS